MLTTWLCSPVSFAHNSYGKFSAKKTGQPVYINEQHILGTTATASQEHANHLNRNLNRDSKLHLDALENQQQKKNHLVRR